MRLMAPPAGVHARQQKFEHKNIQWNKGQKLNQKTVATNLDNQIQQSKQKGKKIKKNTGQRHTKHKQQVQYWH